MSADESKALMEQFGVAMDRKDAAFIAAHPGLRDSLPIYQQLWAAFPDLQGTTCEMITEGAWSAQRVLVSGTMRGAFMGLAPTGKQATWEVIQTFRIVDGTIVESHGQADVLSMTQQLGLAPVPGQERSPLSVDENKALVARFIDEAFNRGNLAAIDALVATAYVNHAPGFPDTPGPESMKRFVTTHRTALPDYACTIEAQIAEGDLVVTRWTVRGTHQGELLGVAPTGRRVTLPGIVIDRIADGQLAETWLQADVLGMLQQLGALPAPGQAVA